jgi:hypothetical protein
VLYPEFATADSGYITAVIAESDLLVSDSWGALRETVLGMETAARLARSPQGRFARAPEDIKSGRNPYEDRLAKLKATNAIRSVRFR